MSCACIKHSGFDIHIDHRDCKTIILDDQSDWTGPLPLHKPEELEVKVSIQSQGITDKTVWIKTDKRNVLTSVDLFGTSEPVCLPNDIYCFEVFNCGVSIKISRAYLCDLDCKIEELIAKSKTPKEEQEYFKLRNRLKTVHSLVKRGLTMQGQDYLDELKRDIKDKNCESC